MAHPKGDEYKLTWGETDIPGILNIDRTSNTGETETTDFDSGKHAEFMPTTSDHTLSLEFQFDAGDTDQQDALADWEDHVVDTLSLEPVDPTEGDRTWSADGFATSVSDTYAKDDVLAFTVDFRITGKPTISYESAA